MPRETYQSRTGEAMIPDYLWNPKDNWAKFKGFGRIFLFIGILLYGVGLLGMRMELEDSE